MAEIYLNTYPLPSSWNTVVAMSVLLPIYPLQSLGQSNRWFPVRTRSKPVCLALTNAQTNGGGQEENVVIVGAGIGGLTTAVSLHR